MFHHYLHIQCQKNTTYMYVFMYVHTTFAYESAGAGRGLRSQDDATVAEDAAISVCIHREYIHMYVYIYPHLSIYLSIRTSRSQIICYSSSSFSVFVLAFEKLSALVH